MDLTLLYKMSYGLYIVSSSSGDKKSGCIVNTVFQITAEPPSIAVSINKDNFTSELINESGKFVVSILTEDASTNLIGKFGFKSGRDIDKFKDVGYKIAGNNCPAVIEGTTVIIECEVVNQVDLFTHTLFLAKIINLETVGNGIPMTYDYYHKVRKGTASKNAPTYQAKVANIPIEKDVSKMSKYVCDICGYEYDPKTGDTEHGIPAGTAFEDISEDWVCPICGASKSSFSKITV